MRKTGLLDEAQIGTTRRTDEVAKLGCISAASGSHLCLCPAVPLLKVEARGSTAKVNSLGTSTGRPPISLHARLCHLSRDEGTATP